MTYNAKLGAMTCSNNVTAPVTLGEVMEAMAMLPKPLRDVIAEAMRKEGFDPEHDWCFVPAKLREYAGPWPPKYLRFSPYLDEGFWFMRNPAPNAALNRQAAPATEGDE